MNTDKYIIHEPSYYKPQAPPQKVKVERNWPDGIFAIIWGLTGIFIGFWCTRPPIFIPGFWIGTLGGVALFMYGISLLRNKAVN